MIGQDLNGKARAAAPTSYEPIPEGDYLVRVKEIKPWKETVKDISINVRDEEGLLVKDSEGKLIKELHKNYSFYNANMTLEVIDGEYKGRLLFTSLTTHPNVSFITENFLYAVEVDEVPYAEIQNTCTNKQLEVGVIVNNENFKTSQDPVTGKEVKTPNPRNEVKTFKRTKIKADDALSSMGL